MIGAAVGVVLVVAAEVVRHLLGEDRSSAELAWGLWVIPFGAFMWSVGGSARRNKKAHAPAPAPAETGG